MTTLEDLLAGRTWIEATNEEPKITKHLAWLIEQEQRHVWRTAEDQMLQPYAFLRATIQPSLGRIDTKALSDDQIEIELLLRDVCAICGAMGPGNVRDHDHVTGAIRGRICSGCNLMVERHEPWTHDWKVGGAQYDVAGRFEIYRSLTGMAAPSIGWSIFCSEGDHGHGRDRASETVWLWQQEVWARRQWDRENGFEPGSRDVLGAGLIGSRPGREPRTPLEQLEQQLPHPRLIASLVQLLREPSIEAWLRSRAHRQFDEIFAED